jgi:hypothetical protein
MLQWKPLYAITLGQIETDHINLVITVTNSFHIVVMYSKCLNGTYQM